MVLLSLKIILDKYLLCLKLLLIWVCFKKSWTNKKTSGSYTVKDQDHICFRFSYKRICIDDKFSKPIVCYRVKDAVHKFIKAIPERYNYCKKGIKKHFNKNLSVSEEGEVMSAGYMKN